MIRDAQIDFKTKIFVLLFSCKLLNLVILDEDLYLSKFNDINVTLKVI